MDAISSFLGGGVAGRQDAGPGLGSCSRATQHTAHVVRAFIRGNLALALVAGLLLIPAARAGYYAAPMDAGDLSETLQTPWVFYDNGYGFNGCFDSGQEIADAWIAWRSAGGACAAVDTGRNPDWPVDPRNGLMIDIPGSGCVPDDRYAIPAQNTIPLVRQHSRFLFDVQLGACGAGDWYPEEWMMHRESYAYCPDGYGFALWSGNPGMHFCKRSKPVYDQCLLETDNLLAIGTGSKKHVDVDFVDTRAGHLQLVRHYNSNYSRIVGKRQDPSLNYEPASGMFGANWRSSYERSIYYPGGPSGTLAGRYGEDATFHFFNRQPDGSWVSNSGVRETLLQTASGWRYRRADDSVEIYDTSGRLQSVHYVDGTASTLAYDAAGALYSVQSSTGESLTFHDDPSDTDTLVDTVTDNTGRVWKYIYDASSNLEYVIYPDGTAGTDADNPVRQYHYEDPAYPHALTGITDERGIRYATYGYDGNGRATYGYQGDSADPAGSIAINYHNDDHLGDGRATRSVIDGSGNLTSYTTIHRNGVALLETVTGPGCAACGTGDSSYSYDPLTNDLLSKTENGMTTEYGSYDAHGNPGFMIEAKGTAVERRTDYSYDPRYHSRISSITEASVFPGASKITGYVYDDYGNRVSEAVSGFDPVGNPVDRVTTYHYDGPLHQLSQIDGPRTDVSDITVFDYYPDDPAEGANRARLRQVTAADGTVLRGNIGYTMTGKVATEERPNNLLIAYHYFPGNDRLQTLTVQDLSTGKSSRTAWSYLPAGEVASITTASQTPDATTLTFDYDAARRLVRITDGLGNYIAYTLDSQGNRVAEDVRDSSGALRKSLSRTFDAYNRLDIRTSGADPRSPLERIDSDFAPDGTLDRQTDGNGVVTDYSYDSLNRLLNTTRDLGGLGAVTRFGYDSGDNLVSVSGPASVNTGYVYDDLGNLLAVSSPDTGTTTYTYDAAGNRTTRRDARGQSVTYTYDALNRLTGVDAAGTAEDISYFYDACANGAGRLCSVTQGSLAVIYAYDAFGNVTGHQQLNYGYDAASRLRTMTYPSGAVVSYRYNAAGQVSRVDLTADGVTATLASGIGYAPFGAVTSLVYGNGTMLTQDMDTAYRLTTQSVPGAMQLGYTRYDGNGNLGTRTDILSGSSYFTYDTLDRLDTGSGPFGVRDYDYDLNGNRTRLDSDGNTTSYGYVPHSNRLSADNGWTYTQDANGNTTHKLAADGLGFVYVYNSHNRLVSVMERKITGTSGKGGHKTPVMGDVTLAVYGYNGLDQRVRKTLADGTVVQFRYGVDGALLAELDGGGTVQREYVYLNGQLLAVLDQQTLQAADDEVIVDNGAAPAGWLSRTSNRDYGADYLYSQGGTGSTVRWTPALTAGTYDVYAWYVDSRKNSSQVPYAISHDGRLDTVYVDQSSNGGSWQLIAQSITFDGSGGEYIEISDVSGRTAGDAVRFVNVAGDSGTTATMVSYVHNDYLGTPQVMTDETGIVVWRAIYDPFGTSAIDPASTQQLHARFPGQYFDGETGLHYNYYRYYDPLVSRYLTADPRGLLLDFSAPERQIAAQSGVAVPSRNPSGHINHPYAYVANNPVMAADPTGEIDPVTAGLIIWGLLYVNHAGDAISDFNGNIWGEPDRQDNQCTLGPIFGAIGDFCFHNRCQKHDDCFAENQCTASSWVSSVLGVRKSCNQCNSGFFK